MLKPKRRRGHRGGSDEQSPDEREWPHLRGRAAKNFGALQVFRDIDFTVGDREIVAIVGPSGCGKTTLLRCIDGLLPADAGEVHVDGLKVSSPVANVAMVFQHFGLFPWKTVNDNVAYGLRMAGFAKAEIARRVPVFINLVGLAGFEQGELHGLPAFGAQGGAGAPDDMRQR